MFRTSRVRRLRTFLLAVPVIAGAALALAGPVSAKHYDAERMVVRGDSTILDQCGPTGCTLTMSGGTFRGTLGDGAYTGTMELALPEAFSNGEDGLCAPIRGRIVLGAGTPDRLVLAVDGDSCQDGSGDPTQASFTGVATFTVKHGTGAYAGARGHGIATFLEDAADHDRMTLIGRIAR